MRFGKRCQKVRWLDETRFRCGSETFLTFGDAAGKLTAERLIQFDRLDSDSERFVIAKTRAMVDRYEQVLTSDPPRHLVELGIYRGGSVAFLNELVRPRCFLAVELDIAPRRTLDEYVARNTTISTYYGVDQADRRTLVELVERHFPGPLDVVIDDASHFVAETRASFNVLFPRVRPGGLYLIEDWAWAHTSDERLHAGRTPLSVFVFELTVAAACGRGLIGALTIYPEFAVVRRGPAPLDADTFDVSEVCGNEARQLLSRLGS